MCVAWETKPRALKHLLPCCLFVSDSKKRIWHSYQISSPLDFNVWTVRETTESRHVWGLLLFLRSRVSERKNLMWDDSCLKEKQKQIRSESLSHTSLKRWVTWRECVFVSVCVYLHFAEWTDHKWTHCWPAQKHIMNIDLIDDISFFNVLKRPWEVSLWIHNVQFSRVGFISSSSRLTFRTKLLHWKWPSRKSDSKLLKT